MGLYVTYYCLRKKVLNFKSTVWHLTPIYFMFPNLYILKLSWMAKRQRLFQIYKTTSFLQPCTHFLVFFDYCDFFPKFRCLDANYVCKSNSTTLYPTFYTFANLWGIFVKKWKWSVSKVSLCKESRLFWYVSKKLLYFLTLLQLYYWLIVNHKRCF